MVINLSSKNGNSLVQTEKNTGAEQLHSNVKRTFNREKKCKGQHHSIKNVFLEMLHSEISGVKAVDSEDRRQSAKGKISLTQTGVIGLQQEKKAKWP